MTENLQPDISNAARRRWMSVLAKARADSLVARFEALGDMPRWTMLRAPETGMVMVRGRAGGVGQRFNLGEMTVTRCAVRIEDGHIGQSYIAGRDRRHAEIAAVLDALLQDPDRRDALDRDIVAPLDAEHSARRAARAAKSAATKVDFFTMARGT